MSLRVDVWSDLACPWCFIGKRRLEAALQASGHTDAEVVWHAFELDPSAPPVQPEVPGYVQRLATKYRRSEAEAQAMIDRVVGVGREDGIDFQFARARAGNTFDAHRLLRLAAARDAAHPDRPGLQGPLAERLFQAYFTEGQALGDAATLQRLAVEVGLDEAAVEAVLCSRQLTEEVRADQATARELGVTGVPFFVFNQRLGVGGAQPAEVLAQAIAQAGQGVEGAEADATADSCDVNGC